MMVATRSVHVPGVGSCAKGAVLADGEALVAAAPRSFVAVLDAKPKRARKADAEVVADDVAGEEPGTVEEDD